MVTALLTVTILYPEHRGGLGLRRTKYVRHSTVFPKCESVSAASGDYGSLVFLSRSVFVLWFFFPCEQSERKRKRERSCVNICRSTDSTIHLPRWAAAKAASVFLILYVDVSLNCWVNFG
jgi:hypothetical protein